MATKSFQDICVEYAHQLGKGLPLTAPEMCNAVIMYLNTQITEMQGITTALQTAVTEAESSAEEAINKADDVSETVNALPKVPTPTTSDNGKVIGVQSGVYALVEQSGGEAPDNMVTTDTVQTISGNKYFKYAAFEYNNKITIKNNSTLMYGVGFPNRGAGAYTFAFIDDIPDFTDPRSVTYLQEEGATITYQLVNPKEFVLPIIAGDNVTIDTDETNTHIVVGLSKNIPVLGDNNNLELNLPENYGGCAINIRKVNNAQQICITNSGIFYYLNNNFTSLYRSSDIKQNFSIQLPNKNGVIACVDDIPDLDNYTGTMHIVQGTAGSGIAVHDTVKASPYTKYGYDKIETYGNSNTLRYTLNIPNKNGTIATLDDISSSPSTSRYFTRVIYHSTDDDTQYIIFSCITDIDLSANTSYQNVIDLLNSLGATTNDTALPCSGKTVSGGILVGVYTDGSNIIVFDTDNSTEELNMSAEIKFISK